jgi:hypothetical protein
LIARCSQARQSSPVKSSDREYFGKTSHRIILNPSRDIVYGPEDRNASADTINRFGFRTGVMNRLSETREKWIVSVEATRNHVSTRLTFSGRIESARIDREVNRAG